MSERPGSVSWYVLVLVGSSALTAGQLIVHGARAPLSLAFLAALLFQAFLLFARRPFDVTGPPGIASAICVMLTGALLAVVHALASGNGDLRTSFLFMYSIGLAMIVYVAAPATVRLTKPFKVFVCGAVAFGVAQATTGSLLLPQSFKDHFGIVYEHFVNHKLRVLSFFPSAPRFAELVAFALIYTVFSVIRAERHRVMRVGAAGVLVFLLYNTFSRSGYLFSVTALFFLLIYGYSSLSMRRDGRPAFTYFALLTSLALGAGYLAFSPAVKDLAVADTASLQARLFHWSEIKSQLSSGGMPAYIFGTGRSAHANALSSDYFVIDNVFYAFMFFGGIVGLLTAAWLYWRTLRTLLHARAAHPELIPMAALLSALPIEGLFLDNHNTLLLVMFAAIGVANRCAQTDSPGQGSKAVLTSGQYERVPALRV